jgi:RNA polymerase sigma-70 factor, ECF subfamily
MSATITYERNNVVNISSSFIGSEEAALLASAVAGDSAAFESLVMPHRGALLRIAQRILRNREDAEDAVQHALLDAFRNLNGFQGRSQFSSWLTRIAMNAALMRLRVNRRERATSLDELLEAGQTLAQIPLMETRPNPEEQYLSKESRVLLQKALRKMSPLYVEVLHLRGVQELSAKESAVLLKLPEGTVKARLHRARAKLSKHLRSITSGKRQLRNIRKQDLIAETPMPKLNQLPGQFLRTEITEAV